MKAWRSDVGENQMQRGWRAARAGILLRGRGDGLAVVRVFLQALHGVLPLLRGQYLFHGNIELHALGVNHFRRTRIFGRAALLPVEQPGMQTRLKLRPAFAQVEQHEELLLAPDAIVMPQMFDQWNGSQQFRGPLFLLVGQAAGKVGELFERAFEALAATLLDAAVEFALARKGPVIFFPLLLQGRDLLGSQREQNFGDVVDAAIDEDAKARLEPVDQPFLSFFVTCF